MSTLPSPGWEFLAHEQIRENALRAMRNHIRYIKEHSPFYAEHLAHIDPAQIQTPEDICRLPFTTKKELATHNSNFFALSPEAIVETVVTSGSTGSPLIVPLSKDDLDRLGYNEAKSFEAAGVTHDMSAQILVSLDRLFIAGLAYYRGLTMLGVNTMRIGVVPFELHRQYFSLFKPTILVGVPSFLLKLGRALADESGTIAHSPTQKIFCIGEPIYDEEMSYTETAKALVTLFGADIYSTYALTETASTFCECTEQNGGHLHPELCYAEIVDEEGRPVADGEIGELVVTPFGVEGLPLLRYRTGDMTFKLTSHCRCGRNSDRIGPIISRKNEMLKIKGTTLYVSTLTSVLDFFEHIHDYIIELSGKKMSGTEEIIVHVVAPAAETEQIMDQLFAATRLRIPVSITNDLTLQRMRGDCRKKIHVVDRRE